MSGHKQFVDVICDHGIGGRVTPLSFRPEDGARIKIDRVLDVRRASSLKAGGCGVRYTIRVFNGEKNQNMYLFDDDGEWFLEV